MSDPTTTTTASPNADLKRLHITPFNADLLERYVPPALRPLASGISYHAVQTAPERGFGYVELPTMEADKLKKKFNGSTLKGAKVRIEEARPEKKRKVDAEVEVEESEDARKARKRAKKEKRKREENMIEGRELEEGRHIKRGWDDGVDKKTAKKLKKAKPGKSVGGDTIEGKTLLFKTSIPPNAEPIKAASKNGAKEKKGKTDKHDKKERSGREKRKAVVQEFAKTQKAIVSVDGPPTGKGVFRYEDGKGWVDAAGNVVEAARPSKRPRRREPTESLADSDDLAPGERVGDITVSRTPAEQDDEPLDDEGSSLDGVGEKTLDDGDVGSDWENNGVLPVQPPVEKVDQAADATAPPPDDAMEDVEGGSEDGSEDVAHHDADALEPPKEVHPLEALFKRPTPKPESATKPKPSPIDTSFNFFNSGAVDEDEVADESRPAYPPQTPHTKRDLEWRSLRSAAPTPDTAAIGRKFSFPFAHGDDDDDEDEDEDSDDEGGDEDAGVGAVQQDVELPDANQVPVAGSKEGQASESEFRKWFYDNRGALNRGWKKRRREERKSKRQQENRRLSRKVV
ncbi:hypothetical protein LTR36_000663 [Oleoguttula mirabilis]|uniref:Uncharacterized protein n=1 Tax=Oleoguttula mirabilis TaxID=1507867 RepID=A0AAV9JQD2_9PEZI|nr:hypothetical protein LTR36_000663 [Oleoguttula mirabilis]